MSGPRVWVRRSTRGRVNLAWLKHTVAFSSEISPMKKLLEQGHDWLTSLPIKFKIWRKNSKTDDATSLFELKNKSF